MTTTTKKKEKIQQQEEEKPNPARGSPSSSTLPPPDRISELPIEILHRILGFLEMDELLIQTSLVSTKWRNLWKSVSTLTFTLHSPRIGASISNDGFVDHVLRLRDSEASKIQIFNYSRAYNSIDYGYLERLHNFIESAVNQGAQEIQVEGRYLGRSGKRIHFNPSIFTSGLLRKFRFAVFNFNFPIQFPRSMCCATQLTHLNLRHIRLPVGDDSNAAQLHLVCPVLEELSICNCYSKHLKVLDISAPRLNTLSILNIMGSESLGGCRIEIRTPNLTSLDYCGHVYVDCFTENLPNVAFANLKFVEETGMVEKTTSFAIKLLKGLTSVETLMLEGFEVFPEDILKELLTPFTSLTFLRLVSSCKKSSIHRMVHFLNSCNSIEILVWGVNEKCTVEGDDGHLMLPQCRLSHLKHVRISGLHGHKYEIELVKFLLKNSVVLEDIIIDTARDSPKNLVENRYKEFCEISAQVRAEEMIVLVYIIIYLYVTQEPDCISHPKTTYPRERTRSITALR